MKAVSGSVERTETRAHIRVRDLYRWHWRPQLRRRSFRLLTRLFGYATGWLPDIARLALRQAKPVVRSLDYEKGDVRIYADSWVEYDKRAFSCSKEPETIAWLETHIKPGDVVYDIGANVGAYSLLIGRRFRGEVKVYAFEPSFSTFAQLSRNVALNGVSDAVYPMYIALSDKSGLGFFKYSSLDAGTALHALEMESADAEFKAVHRQPVLSFTLDEMIERFCMPYPDHIKLDVDGIEHAILTGAVRTLAHPGLRSLIVESEETRPGTKNIQTLLRSAGFELESEHVHDSNPLHKGPYVRNCIYRRSIG